MTFGWAHWLIALVAAQRLAELIYARRNAAALLARGGIETGAAHYPMFVILHAAWLAAMFALTAPDPPPNWLLLSAFFLLQAFRVWVIASLGAFWTTRVIVVPDTHSVTSGPYRFVRHPNYLIVACEVPLLPLALGLPLVAAVFGLLNAALLVHRVRVEEAARGHLT